MHHKSKASLINCNQLVSVKTALLSFFFFISLGSMAATRTWDGSSGTNWNTASNWVGDVIPVAADIAYIPGGLSNYPIINNLVNISAVTINTSATGASITIAAGGSLIATGLITVNATGSFISTGGTASIAGITSAGLLNVSGGTITTSVDITLNTGATLNHSSGILHFATNTGTLPTDNLYVNAGATINQSGGTIYTKDVYGSGTFNQTNSSALFQVYRDWRFGTGSVFNSSAGTVQFTGVATTSATFAAGTRQFNNIIVDASDDPKFSQASASTINISGNFTNSNTTLTNTTNSTFIFNGTGAQTITTTSTNATFGNLTVNKASGTLALSSNVFVAANMTITLGVLDLNSYFLNRKTAGGTFSIASGTFIHLGANNGGQTGSNFPLNFTTNTILSGSTIVYDGSNAIVQTIYGAVAYSNLVLTNATGTGTATKITTANLTVNSTLTVNNGAVLTPGAAFTVGGTGTLTGAGTVTVNRTLATASFLGQYTISNKTLTALTVDYTATAAQTVNALAYHHLHVGGARAATSVTFQNSGTIGVSGNFTVSATYTSGSNIVTGSTFQLNGNAAQSIPAFAFNNLTIANTNASVSLSGNVTVSGILNFVDGNLITGAYVVALPSGGSVTGAGSSTGWVYGTLQKYFSAPSGGIYEIGDETNYTPLTISFAGITTAGSLKASTTNTNHPNISGSNISQQNISRYFTLSNPASNILAFTSATVAMQWAATDNFGSIIPASLIVAKYTGTTWSYPTLSGATTSTSITATGVTSVGDLAIGQVCTVTSGFSYAAASFCSSTASANATLNNGATAGTFSAAPAGLSINSINGTVDIGASIPGTYVITNTVSGICASTSTTSFTIAIAPGATIQYAGGPYCTGNGPATVSLAGTTGGIFSAPAGVSINASSGNIDLATSAAGTFTITYTVAPANGCAQYSTTTSLTILTAGTWTGAISSEWKTPGNWVCNTAPTATTNVSIPGGLARYPFIAANDKTSVNNITVQAGASLTIKGELEIVGAITSTNAIIADSGIVTMKGSAAQTILANTFQNNSLLDLKISNTANVTLAGALSITNSLHILNGSLNTGGNLTLVSNIYNTARIAEITSLSATPIVGDVTVERYVPGRRKYRLVTSSVTTSTSTTLTAGEEAKSIWGNWQNQGINTVANVGTTITGGLSADGFDQQSANASMFTYNDATKRFIPFSSANGKNTKLTPLKAGLAYYMFIYGDRRNSITASIPNATVLKAKGKVSTGTITLDKTTAIPLTDVTGRFTLIGNPYACTIDWKAVSKTDISNTIWGWDANLSSTGGYVTVTATVNGALIAPLSSLIAINRYVQPGQGFFVKTLGANPKIEFKEVAKINDNMTINSNVFRMADANNQKLLAVNLLYDNAGTKQLADGSIIAFDSSFSNTVTDDDGIKMTSSTEAIGIANGAETLSIEARQIPVHNDTIHLHLARLTRAQYTLQVFAKDMMNAGVAAYLLDGYLGTEQLLSVADTNNVTFSINTSIAASSAWSRFKIVFKQAGTLPVNYTSITATKKDDNVVVGWSVAQEAGIIKYEVERSVNGVEFNKLGEVMAKNTGRPDSYTYTDNSPFQGKSYYRTKALQADGKILYSRVVAISNHTTSSGLIVFSNPVTNSRIELQLNAIPRGNYALLLLNAQGQQLHSHTINHSGGTSSLGVDLPIKVAAGIYFLQLIGSDLHYHKSVLFE